MTEYSPTSIVSGTESLPPGMVAVGVTNAMIKAGLVPYKFRKRPLAAVCRIPFSRKPRPARQAEPWRHEEPPKATSAKPRRALTILLGRHEHGETPEHGFGFLPLSEELQQDPQPAVSPAGANQNQITRSERTGADGAGNVRRPPTPALHGPQPVPQHSAVHPRQRRRTQGGHAR